MGQDARPVVRPATAEDVPAIRRIARAGWRAAYGDFLSDDVLVHARETWHTAETFRESIERDDVSWFVACEQVDEPPEAGGTDRVVGYASGGRPADRKHAIVGTLYVDPDRWGEGYGSAVFDRVIDDLRDRGADRVEIHVFAENLVGRSFYESRGFGLARRATDEIAGETVDVVVYAGEL